MAYIQEESMPEAIGKNLKGTATIIIYAAKIILKNFKIFRSVSFDKFNFFSLSH
jgi:hypothetical protein